jgi:hypothetical protein
LNNTRVTGLSTVAEVSGVLGYTQLQIVSRADGSDGYVHVTGGSANELLGFSITTFRGLLGYNYYTGILKLAHKTIYGDDADSVTFPGIGAAGIQFRILPPQIRDIRVSLQLTLGRGINLSQVEDAIKSEIITYINNLDIGEDVILEEIRARVIRLSNVIDVVAVLPTSNVAISDNEKAKTRAGLITLG